MREAAIVSTARTPIGKAYRGAFNDTQGQALAAHAIAEANAKEPASTEDLRQAMVHYRALFNNLLGGSATENHKAAAQQRGAA